MYLVTELTSSATSCLVGEENTMHPTISYELTQARTADLHHQAQHDALARAARRTRRTRRQQPRHLAPRLTAVVPRWRGQPGLVPGSLDGARHAS
jgi:hypothetical protein